MILQKRHRILLHFGPWCRYCDKLVLRHFYIFWGGISVIDFSTTPATAMMIATTALYSTVLPPTSESLTKYMHNHFNSAYGSSEVMQQDGNGSAFEYYISLRWHQWHPLCQPVSLQVFLFISHEVQCSERLVSSDIGCAKLNQRSHDSFVSMRRTRNGRSDLGCRGFISLWVQQWLECRYHNWCIQFGVYVCMF